MICELRDFLSRERAPFEVVERQDTVNVSDSPTASRASGRLARVVILRDRDSYALAVLPAEAVFDLTAFRRLTRRYAVTLADEVDFRKAFPEVADGPLPPFGRMFGILVYLDRALASRPAITFESGGPGEVIDMPMSGYVRVERPAIVAMTEALRAA